MLGTRIHRSPPVYRPCALDGLSAVWFAGSIARRAYAGYNGPLFTAQLAGGGQRDIYPVGQGAGSFDLKSLENFAAGAEVRLRTIFNQDPNGGGGGNLAQTSYSIQSKIWDASTGPVFQNGVLHAAHITGNIYTATPGLTTATSPALTYATVLKRDATDGASCGCEIGHTSGTGDGAGWTPLIFDGVSTDPLALYQSYEGSAHTKYVIADSQNLNAYVVSKALNANANALTGRQNAGALSGTPTGTKTLSLAANVFHVNGNHNSGGSITLTMKAWASCWVLAKSDVIITAGTELASLELFLAQHMSI